MRDDFSPPAWFIVAWIFCALASLGVTAVIVWAIVRLVVHFT
jgi:hypothetical protein